MTLNEIVLSRVFDACIDVLDNKGVSEVEAVCKVGRKAKLDRAITQTAMIELAKQGVITYKNKNYSVPI